MAYLTRRSGIIVLIGLIFLFLLALPVLAAEPAEQLFQQLSGLSEGEYSIAVHMPTGKASFLRITQPLKQSQAQLQAAAGTADDIARLAFARYGEVFGIHDHAKELTVTKKKTGANGNQFVRYRQHRSGVPVFGGDLIVQVNGSMEAVAISGKASDKQIGSVAPQISAAQAEQAAINSVKKGFGNNPVRLVAAAPELWVYNPALLKNDINREFLVWRTEVTSPDAPDLRELVLVDAASGGILLRFNQIHAAKNRTIYDKNNVPDNTLPGTLVRSEGGILSIIADANYAYDYTGITYDFYYTYFGRDSVNGAGLGLVSTVRYCPSTMTAPCSYGNAFWNGTQMVFGDGFANALDVVGHELTHGVTANESGLFYYMQSGSINESLSDIFGEIIQQTYQTVSPANRWLIGETLPIGAIRSMQNPPLYGYYDAASVFHPNPDRMNSTYYYCGDLDNGGVHWNSGVGNKAAYLMVDGAFFNDRTVTGIGLIKTARIYYEAQTNLLTSASDYQSLYNALQAACSNLIGTSGITAADCVQVQNAVNAVAMNLQPTSCAAVEAPMCPSGLPTYLFNDKFESGLAANWTTGYIPHPEITGFVNNIVWQWVYGYSTSGIYSANGVDRAYPTDSFMAMNSNIAIPANAFLHFNHAYLFDYYSPAPGPYYYDGGVLEYSINSGDAWTDAGPLISGSAYTEVIASGFSNPLAGRSAFAGSSNGYGSSRVNLASLGGQNNVRFRFRVGSDISDGSLGWIIDDVQIYTCNPCPGMHVNIGGTYDYYPTIQAGYTAATEHQSVLLQAGSFEEPNVTFANASDIKLKGGHDCTFSTSAGWTTLYGKLTIRGGSVKIENLIVK